MYKIDFINIDGSIAHILTLESGLCDIKISAQKIASSDYFAMEPRKIEWTHFLDEWIKECVMSGEYEHEHFILKYRVQLYVSGVLNFTGVVDTSFISYDEETQVVSFVAYDYLKLLDVYGDSEKMVNLISYDSWQAFKELIEIINNKMFFEVVIDERGYTKTSIRKYITFAEIPIDDILEGLTITDKHIDYEHANDPRQFYMGFNIKQPMRYIQRIRYIAVNDSKENILLHRFRTHYIFNNICVLECSTKKFDTESPWGTSTKGAFSMIYDVFYNNVRPSYRPGGFTYDSNITKILPNELFNELKKIENGNINLNYYGEIIPRHLALKGCLENTEGNVKLLEVLKLFLILHNLTIICDPNGVLKLLNKNDTTVREPITIDKNDVFSFAISRKNRETVNPDVFNCLMGNTDTLYKEISDFYKTFFDNMFEIQITLSNNYNLELFDTIEIGEYQCQISSIRNDFEKETLEVTAWQKR